MRLAQQRLEALYADHTLPLVFGHRGAMAYAPMNTLAAFELAAQQGAHGIELDVWLSADDALVVIHDFEVNHTTNGEGRVGSMSLAEIKALDAGSWFSPEFAGTQIPTLDEVFETVGKKVFVNVEIKSVSMDNQTIVQRVSDTIERHHMAERVIVSSFNPLAIWQMRRANPNLPLGYLDASENPLLLKLARYTPNYEAWHAQHTQITPHNARQRRPIHTWTVNDPEEAKRLRDWGVKAIITDKPDVILAALAE